MQQTPLQSVLHRGRTEFIVKEARVAGWKKIIRGEKNDGSCRWYEFKAEKWQKEKGENMGKHGYVLLWKLTEVNFNILYPIFFLKTLIGQKYLVLSSAHIFRQKETVDIIPDISNKTRFIFYHI